MNMTVSTTPEMTPRRELMRTGSAGFTLLEMLVVLVIIGLIMGRKIYLSILLTHAHINLVGRVSFGVIEFTYKASERRDDF